MKSAIPKCLDIVADQVSLRPESIMDLLGQGDRSSTDYTFALIRQLIGESLKTAEPSGGYLWTRATGNSSSDEISIPGVRFKTGKTVRKMLLGSESFVFFIASAGRGPEEMARSLLRDGLYLEAYIADLIGSAMVESVALMIHEKVREEAGAEGNLVTNRYSPGYCGWDVTEQKKLFSLFPSGFCGVLLSSSSLMLPIKSVSGVIGSGKSVTCRDYTCEICSMKECLFRRTRSFSGPVGRS